MKITDPQIILNGEKDLIASVQKDLDLNAVRDLLKDRLTLKALSSKGGQIVVHDNEVAFRLDYEINIDGSLLFDRNGNLLEDNENTVAEQDPQHEDAIRGSDLDDNLSINLPDYDNASNDEPGEAQDVLEPQALLDDKDVEPGLEIEELEDDSAFDQDDSDNLEANNGDDIGDLSVTELPDIGLEDGDKETGQDVVDDDISDILQESRDFWETKKK